MCDILRRLVVWEALRGPLCWHKVLTSFCTWNTGTPGAWLTGSRPRFPQSCHRSRVRVGTSTSSHPPAWLSPSLRCDNHVITAPPACVAPDSSSGFRVKGQSSEARCAPGLVWGRGTRNMKVHRSLVGPRAGRVTVPRPFHLLLGSWCPCS